MRFRTTLLALALTAACDAPDGTPAPAAQTAPERPPDEETATALTEEQMTPATMRRFQQTCPMMVEGVEVEVEDTSDGVAMMFRSQQHADDLRPRVRHMADMYAMHQGQPHGMMWGRTRGMHGGGMHGTRGGGMHGGGMHMGAMPASEARYEEIEDGARIVLTPTDRAELDALRQHVGMHQARMSSGQCWIHAEAPDEGS